MYIIKYDQYKLDRDRYSVYKKFDIDLHFLSIFLTDVVYYDFRMKIQELIQDLDTFHSDGQGFDFVELDVDHKNNMIYLSEPYSDYMKKIPDPKFYEFYSTTLSVILCQNNLIEHLVITKNNFVHVLSLWTECWEHRKAFALLYQDDQGWYDVLPFDTQETMEQFIADHTAIEDIHE